MKWIAPVFVNAGDEQTASGGGSQPELTPIGITLIWAHYQRC
ncbi:hypothetical protein LJPFL01_2668 [Lelliottia jeotgali]|nr:hypothetical protein LJPFL01_2668 [Lelliottia jeotgali]